MTDFNTLFGGDITQFHFMRPLWLLALIPFVLFYRALVQQDDLVAQWQPVMSKNMVEHLSLNQNRARMVSPNRLFLVFAVVARRFERDWKPLKSKHGNIFHFKRFIAFLNDI